MLRAGKLVVGMANEKTWSANVQHCKIASKWLTCAARLYLRRYGDEPCIGAEKLGRC